jgi:hypothetical protein
MVNLAESIVKVPIMIRMYLCTRTLRLFISSLNL